MPVGKYLAALWDRFLSWLDPPAIMTGKWREQALCRSRCGFVVWLADQVASDLLANRSWHVSIDELVQAVDQSMASELQHDAERFIEKHYFTPYPATSPQFYRTLLIFRHCIQKRLRQYENACTTQPRMVI